MFKTKDIEPKMSEAKRTITVENVYVNGDMLCDEEGSIAQGILQNLPDGIDAFTIKITVKLPEDDA